MTDRITRFSAAALAAALLLPGAAAAGEFEMEGSEYVQNGWQPNQYRVFCGTYNATARDTGGIQRFDLDDERDSPCFPASLRSLIRTRMSTGLAGIREMSFRAPPVFGPRMNGDDDDGGHIRLYEGRGGSIASTRLACDGTGMSFITLKQGMLEFQNRRHLISYFLAHELFHTVQHGYPAWHNDARNRARYCGMAGWISESTADAVATELTRQAFPRLFPSHGSEREIRKFAGMRRYDIPLNVQRHVSTGETVHYLTSSFWRHLAETYHHGDYRFIGRYFATRPDDRDWLGWLNNRLQTDGQIDAHLSLVYPVFVADLANWGRQGRPGEAMGQEAWLARTFNGCHTISLSPGSPSDSVELGLRRTAAECIRVRVSGVNPGERASVKVAATATDASGPAESARYADQLHLSIASTTDRTGFNCNRWIRRHGRRGGLYCLFVPDTGSIRIGDGPAQQARVWTVRPNESAIGGNQQIDRGGGFTNVYMLSRVAVDPHEEPSDDDGGTLLSATVYFSLDVSRIEASPTGQTSGDTGSDTGGPDRGNTDGDGRSTSADANPNRQRGGSETRVVGTFNQEPPVLAQEALPTYGPDGSRTVTHTNPAQFRPQLPSFPFEAMMRRRAGIPDDAIMNFQVGHVEVQRASPYERSLDGVDTYMIMALEETEDGYEPRPIRIGETGTFVAAIWGGTNQLMYGTFTENLGRMEIVTHTRQAIHLRVSGTLCRVLPPPTRPGCTDASPFRAEMIKAFPAAYTPEGRFTVYDTPGTAIYRTGKSNEFRRRTGEDPDSGDDGDETGDNGGDSSSSSAAVQQQCDCSCDALERFREQAEELRDRQQSGGEIDMAEITRMTRCMQQCAPQLAQCRQ